MPFMNVPFNHPQFNQATGFTPLMYAVKDSRVGIADKFLDIGQNVNARAKVSEPMRFRHIRVVRADSDGQSDTVESPKTAAHSAP